MNINGVVMGGSQHAILDDDFSPASGKVQIIRPGGIGAEGTGARGYFQVAEHDVLAELGNDAHAVHIVNMAVIPEDVFASVLKEAAAVPPGIAVLVGLARFHGWGAFLERDADFSGRQLSDDCFPGVETALESAGGGIENFGIPSHAEFPAGSVPGQVSILHCVQDSVRNSCFHGIPFNFRDQKFPHGRMQVIKPQAVQGNVFRMFHADKDGFSFQQDVGGSRLSLQAYVFGFHQADSHGLGLVGRIVGVGNLRFSGHQGTVFEDMPAGHEPDGDRGLFGSFPHQRQGDGMFPRMDDERISPRHDETVGRRHAFPRRGWGRSRIAVISLVRVYMPDMVSCGLRALRPFRIIRCRAWPCQHCENKKQGGHGVLHAATPTGTRFSGQG